MITFWNRKEVYMGYSLNEFNKAIDILNANKIKYDFKYGNVGGLSLTNQNNGECYIYVHKRDFEKASFVLHDLRRG